MDLRQSRRQWILTHTSTVRPITLTLSQLSTKPSETALFTGSGNMSKVIKMTTCMDHLTTGHH
eukprot:15299990-Ditylum_brightwellii.AAC.1